MLVTEGQDVGTTHWVVWEGGNNRSKAQKFDSRWCKSDDRPAETAGERKGCGERGSWKEQMAEEEDSRAGAMFRIGIE